MTGNADNVEQAGVRHAGQQAVAAMLRFGTDVMFTLNGGHIWPFYEGARDQGMRIVDTRHEQSATFAAEAYAKLTRRPGLAALTAGPGVTNGISAITTAHFNGSPLVVLGGRAPQARWGAGSLQELDHVPLVAPITKEAITIGAVEDIPAEVGRLARVAATPHRGPVFADLPLDVVFASATVEVADADAGDDLDRTALEADPAEVAEAARLLATAERPAVVAGSDVYWAGAWTELRDMVEALRVPVFSNGLGRGCLPADHELAFSRTRGRLRSDADLVAVVGTPLDFRLSFGRFGSARVVHVVDHPDQRAAHAEVAATPAGDLRDVLAAMAQYPGDRADHEDWIARLRDAENAAAAGDAEVLEASAAPIKPGRIYGELRRRLDRDAVVICD